jgi:hypothetical protein
MESIQNFAKKIFGQKNILKIEPVYIKYVKSYKIVVFTPGSHVEKIAKVMSESGAGKIGKYSGCSFRLEGRGTFKGEKGTNPYLGEKGKLETVDEIRLEMICSPENLNKTIDEMLKVHPYDEPAYDIYEVLNGVRGNKISALMLELKPLEIPNVFKKINSKIDSSLLPEDWKKIKIKNAVIDFSGEGTLSEIIRNKKHKTLYIAKNFKRIINIRLI